MKVGFIIPSVCAFVVSLMLALPHAASAADIEDFYLEDAYNSCEEDLSVALGLIGIPRGTLTRQCRCSCRGNNGIIFWTQIVPSSSASACTSQGGESCFASSGGTQMGILSCFYGVTPSNSSGSLVLPGE